MRSRTTLLAGLVILSVFALFAERAAAAVILPALRGNDLTDPENNGDPENNVNYNAIFAASEEPTFGGAEAAFNVFDNLIGGGNNKWCCGDQNNFPTNPISITATFANPIFLRRFTITSGNDTPTRDPRVWAIAGSNDGVVFTDIFVRNDPNTAVWTARDQTLEFSEGADYAVQAASYSSIRFLTTATGATTGARFQLAELEYFNTAVPEPASFMLLGLAACALLPRRRCRN